MVKDNRVWVHPNAIRRGEPGESGRYLRYFRHWEHFTLIMDHYRFVRWTASHNTNQYPKDPAFEAAAEKLSEQGWDALDKEEREVFAEHHMKQIGADTLQEGVNLEGWGRLEGGIGRETITAFAVDDDPNSRPQNFDEDYVKTFSKLRVSVLSAEKEYPGSMWVWDKSMLDMSRDDDLIGDEDALYVQFYMLPDKLKAFARDVAIQPVRPTLTLNAQGLLFRDEVEAAFSEPWHSRELVMIYDHMHQAILNSIRFDLQTGAAQPALQDETTDHPVQPATPALVIPEPILKGLHGLKRAIWLLAAAIVLAAIIR
jgi:hypothetical protein